MLTETRDLTDPRIQRAVAELQDMVLARFPDAVFDVFPSTLVCGIYMRITVDIDDPDEVTDVIHDRLVDMQLDEGLPIYPVSVRPSHRIAEYLEARSRSQNGVEGAS